MPLRISIGIPIGAAYGVCWCACISSDDGVYSDSMTDTGHKCGMYMWFDAFNIGQI